MTIVDAPAVEFSFTRRRSIPRLTLIGIVVAAVSASAVAAGVGRGTTVNTGGWALASEFFSAAAHPRLESDLLAVTWDAMLTTIAYAVLGTALALALGALLAPLVSRVWWRSEAVGRWLPAWAPCRGLLAAVRGIHEVIWGLFFLNVFGVDPMVAVLAIGIPFGAVTAKVYSEILDETPRHVYAALRASGAGKSAALLYGIVPQALPDLVSYGFYRFECAIRSAAILGIVGAGGLGFQIALSFQSLRYDEVWTFLYALIALCGLADLWSGAVRGRRMPGLKGNGSEPARDRLRRASVVLAAGLLAFSLWWVHVRPGVLVSGRTWDLLSQIVSQAFPPTTGTETWGRIARFALDTLAMSILAGAIAFSIAMLLAYPAARLPSAGGRRALARNAIMLATRLVLLVLRAIPPPVGALICLFLLFPGILPGAIALGLYNGGVVARLCAEAVENADSHPAGALRGSGASSLATFLYATVPVTVGRFAAYGIYRWEVAMRETVVVGVVGAGGLGLLLDHQLAAFDYAAVLTTVAVVVALTLLADLAGAAARGALSH